MNEKLRNNGLTEVLSAFRRRAWVIGACILLVIGAAIAFSLLAEKKYTATASLLVRQERLSGDLFGDQSAFEVSDPVRLLETNLRLLALDEVADRAAAEIGGGATGGEVERQVEFEATEDSDVISIKATTPSAELSSRTANRFAEAFVDFRVEADRKKVEEAQESLEDQLDSGTLTPTREASLERRVDELQTLADLQTGGVELVEPANTPNEASSPNLRTNALIGAFGGLLLGLGLVLALEQTDRRIRRPEELQEIFQLPLVGTIPESSQIRNGGPGQHGDWRSAEAFRMLRASLLYFDVDRELKSVLVTSASPNDGKTTISLGLAVAAAGPGLRVLLIEADLRRPSLASALGLEHSPGLSTVLRRKEPQLSRAAVQSITIESSPGDGDASNAEAVTIDVLVAGPHPPNAAALMESQAMTRLLKSAEDSYDLVVVDTSPVGVISDAIPLFEQVSGVLLVTRMGESTRDDAGRIKGQLDAVNAPILGVVANCVRPVGNQSAYAYYGDPKAEE